MPEAPDRASPAPVELLRALAHLAEPPGPAHAPLARALGLPEPPDAAAHTDLFGFQLYPYASVHLGPEGMMGGEALQRVEGFWRAVGREVPEEADHLASLVGLYAALSEEEGEVRRDAEERGPAASGGGAGEGQPGEARAALVRRSRVALLDEHLGPWVFAFLDRVGELARGFYAEWAGMLADVLEDEVRREGRPEDPANLRSAHLRAAPPLPDPRSEGAGPFLAGLLAPVRSGVILTRADLARVAARLDLGLRAGERRYALEHLLAQDASAVLEALTEEADRQAAAHQARVELLGGSAIFHSERARTTAGLLRTLGSEPSTHPLGTRAEQDS